VDVSGAFSTRASESTKARLFCEPNFSQRISAILPKFRQKGGDFTDATFAQREILSGRNFVAKPAPNRDFMDAESDVYRIGGRGFAPGAGPCRGSEVSGRDADLSNAASRVARHSLGNIFVNLKKKNGPIFSGAWKDVRRIWWTGPLNLERQKKALRCKKPKK